MGWPGLSSSVAVGAQETGVSVNGSQPERRILQDPGGLGRRTLQDNAGSFALARFGCRISQDSASPD
eukprot:4110751-Pyramimonas_sp.AAC.1